MIDHALQNIKTNIIDLSHLSSKMFFFLNSHRKIITPVGTISFPIGYIQFQTGFKPDFII